MRIFAKEIGHLSEAQLLDLVSGWPNREEVFFLLSAEVPEGNEGAKSGDSADDVNRWSFLGFGQPGGALEDALRKEVEIPSEISHIPFIGGAMFVLPYDSTPFVFWADRVLACDRAKEKTYLIAQRKDDLKSLEKMVCIACESGQNLPNKSNRCKTTPPGRSDAETIFTSGQAGHSTIRSNLTREEYISHLEIIKEKLRAGETYQVNFAQKFEAEGHIAWVPAERDGDEAAGHIARVPAERDGDEAKFASDPFEIFKRVNELNPSPFQCYVQTHDWTLVSNSPERLLCARKVSGFAGATILESRPIKGTIARGKNEAEDAEQAEKLLASTKDEAELTMIVDLVRNDLGIVSEIGSVRVKEHRKIEKYSHVIHTVSIVESTMRKDKTLIDALYALFPGGSVTGCPKKRTMEIIKTLEPCPRGMYTGSAGYISLNGNMDANILIRSITVDNRAGTLSFHSGGGIVIDSDPEKEYEETLMKAAALAKALS